MMSGAAGPEMITLRVCSAMAAEHVWPLRTDASVTLRELRSKVLARSSGQQTHQQECKKQSAQKQWSYWALPETPTR